MFFVVFFFSSRRRHTRCGRDWSSDVCSSDLEVLVRGIAAEVCEWQNDDRQSRGRNWCRSPPVRAFFWTDGVSPGRAANILQTELAQIDEICVDLASNLLIRGRRNANAARLSNTLKPRRNIDAIAEDVVG